MQGVGLGKFSVPTVLWSTNLAVAELLFIKPNQLTDAKE